MLVRKLISEPYGMRVGLIPFYVAYVFANRREDIIVYFSNKELQITPEIVVNMCEQPEDYSVYVSKEDIQKEKYIAELNTLFQVEENRNLTSNRIKNIIICMQRWFRALPQATRNTMNLEQYISRDSNIRAIKALKKAMQKVEYNPFEILFVDSQMLLIQILWKILIKCWMRAKLILMIILVGLSNRQFQQSMIFGNQKESRIYIIH